MNINTSDLPSSYNVASLSAYSRTRLEPRFGKGESTAMVREIWSWLKGWNLTDLAINATKPVSVFVVEQFEKTIDRLLNGEPLQYITGEAYFYGMTFNVDRSTLIPRPETAELVDMIVRRYSSYTDLRVLDIGTGSGCIAIALARNLPFSKVTALDVSPTALNISRENALRLKVKLNCVEADIRSLPVPSVPIYDIIVSNPPYITLSERTEMDRMVVDHEPSTALFVPDEDPLIFYREILRYTAGAVADNGTLYFEINPLFATDLLNLVMNQSYWTEIDIIRDMHGKNRFLTAMRLPR